MYPKRCPIIIEAGSHMPPYYSSSSYYYHYCSKGRWGGDQKTKHLIPAPGLGVFIIPEASTTPNPRNPMDNMQTETVQAPPLHAPS